MCTQQFRRGSGDSMQVQGDRRNTGNPSGDGTCPPTGDPRGLGRAVWGGGRSVVPEKPSNVGGGKGPQFRVNARRGKARGDWCEPKSSRKCAEASDGIACQSEGNALLSLLCAVRQAVPGGHPGACMAAGQGQWRGG